MVSCGMNTHKGDTVDMFKRSIQICSMIHTITLSVFLLIISHGTFAGAEEVRGHGNIDEVMVKVDGDPVTRGDILRRIRIAKGDIDPSKMEPDRRSLVNQGSALDRNGFRKSLAFKMPRNRSSKRL
jgi:hypothetical protein